ncbi:MAG: helix-turn-helix domain-containing protein [Rhizomicrobium sp.]
MVSRDCHCWPTRATCRPVRPTKDEPEDRSATRLAIVTAARAVAERDGVESLTLSKVAVEAGLPRGAVYRQFTRKEDLLMSIVSDDLASLARNMRGIDWQAGGETPESAIVVPLQRAAEPEPVAAPAEVADLAKDVSAALEAAQPSERRLTRRADLLRVLNVAPEAKGRNAGGRDGPTSPHRAPMPGSSGGCACSSAAWRRWKRARSRSRRTPAPSWPRRKTASRRWRPGSTT